MPFDHPIASAVLPVVAVVAAGWVAARREIVSREAVASLAKLVFYVFGPALLFRGASRIDLSALEFGPVVRYYAVAVGLYVVLAVAYGGDTRAAVLALAGVFSNMLMVGMPVVGLAFGQAGFTIIFSLVATQALVLLSVATFALESAVAREQSAGGHARRSRWGTVGRSIRGTLLHPVPLPILAGIAYGASGLPLPTPVDRTLELLGSAFAPLALVLVGASLAHARTVARPGTAMQLALVKTIVHPLLMAGVGRATGLTGLPLAVLIVAASLPIGANAFLFARIYHREELTVTAATAISTVFGLVSVGVALALTEG